MDKKGKVQKENMSQNTDNAHHWYDPVANGNVSKRKKNSRGNQNKKNSTDGKSNLHTFKGDKSNSNNSGNGEDKGKGIHSKAQNKSGKTRSAIVKSGQAIAVRNLFDTALDGKAQDVLDNFDDIVQDVLPATSRQRREGRYGIRDLSHSLTDERSERRRGYMNNSATLSPYTRYFVWWNLVRLTRLFKTIANGIQLSDGGVCLDVGSGPLTVPIALWLSRPELRSKRLTWICQDISQNALDLGKSLFKATASMASAPSGDEPWKIISIRASAGEKIKERAALITCANVLNELQDNEHLSAEETAKRYGEVFARYAAGGETYDNEYSSSSCTLLFVEPGVPPMAHVLSLMREQFLSKGWHTVSPCPHEANCPMNGEGARTGGKSKWCNFAFDTADTPERLRAVSADAGLVKRRAVLSYLLMKNAEAGIDSITDKGGLASGIFRLRIASDPIYLPGYRTGYYACSPLGLSLVIDTSGRRYESGDEVTVHLTAKIDTLEKDKKTGAVILYL